MMAICVLSDGMKSFSLDKMEPVDAETAVTAEFNPEAAVIESFRSLDHVIEKKLEWLQSLGWEVKSTPTSIDIRWSEGRGKSRRGASASIYWSDDAQSRPWSVRTSNLNTRSFKDLGSAANALLDAAEKLKRPDVQAA